MPTRSVLVNLQGAERSMKLKIAICCLSLGMVLIGCGKKEEPPPAVNPQVIEAQKKVEEANRQRDVEQKKAAESEKSKKAAEESVQKSQMIAVGLGFATVIALFIGIGMGSSGKRAAAKTKKAADE